MEGSRSLPKSNRTDGNKKLHFEVSTGLKRVLGRELITDDEVAILEMVKNSFDAEADKVMLFFSDDSIVIADNGIGMSYEDLNEKWLFVAYSAKRPENAKDFRDVAAERGHFAGSKGVGRFSSDRLGHELILQTRPRGVKGKVVHRLAIDWNRFERNDKEHFDRIPVAYSETTEFQLPTQIQRFGAEMRHGTVIEIRSLRQQWNRHDLLDLKSALAKLINPFGEKVDKFTISIVAPAEVPKDRELKEKAATAGEDPVAREIVNGRVRNFIFATLQDKTTYIEVKIEEGFIQTSLTDRGEVIYKVREPNPYKLLDSSGFRCELYYLNMSAKTTFARRVGLPSVQFGSVFVFRNGFRVYPIGEENDDWFGFDRRKQQGFARFLGTRDIIGRVDVSGSEADFQEASSRNQGLIETPSVRELKDAVMERCLKRLEKYVVPVTWVDKEDKNTEDISRLLTDPGRARVSAVVANLVDNDEVELLDYSKRLVSLINERSSDFETSLASLRSIAEKAGDRSFLAKIEGAEKRFEKLRKSEAQALEYADRQRKAAVAATERAEVAESTAATERRRAHFLEKVVSVDAATILSLHHQVTIYAVNLGQQIENLLADTAGQKTVSRDAMLKAMEQMAFLNRKILAVTRFAPQATFKLDSGKIDTDFAAFITDYISQVVRLMGSARMRIDVTNDHPGSAMKFNPIDASIIVDNLISNAKRAKASRISFALTGLENGGLLMKVSDNGRGLSRDVDKKRIFEMGYTTTNGSGLGLYHVRQVLGELGGTIEIGDSLEGKGMTFIIKLTPRKRLQ